MQTANLRLCCNVDPGDKCKYHSRRYALSHLHCEVFCVYAIIKVIAIYIYAIESQLNIGLTISEKRCGLILAWKGKPASVTAMIINRIVAARKQRTIVLVLRKNMMRGT